MAHNFPGFCLGLFEGIANIEARGYNLLADLGAGEVTKVVSAGGGAKNTKWKEIRQMALGVPVIAAEHGKQICPAFQVSGLVSIQGITTYSSLLPLFFHCQI